MIRHRCKNAALAAAALAAAASLPSASRAQGVQVFINTAYVASLNKSDPPPGFAANNFCSPQPTVPVKFICEIPVSATIPVTRGDISSDPHIEFTADAFNRCNTTSFLPVGSAPAHYCNDRVYLCAQIGTSTGAIVIDEVKFELFKFQDGSNALDSGSTPPLRTFFIDNPGASFLPNNLYLPSSTEAYCVLWDGQVNLQGELGKTNGQFGFRVKVVTNQVNAVTGNITITAERAYPSGATRDSTNTPVSQKPIVVDVVDVHVIRSTPSVVGQITGVAAQPYNFTYRLSKDATMYINVNESIPPAGTANYFPVRKVLPGLGRIGEGTPQGFLLNGDSWDGRDDNGNVMPAGSYLVVFQANAVDQYTTYPGPVGGDLSASTTRQLSVDPLTVTDLRVQPLLGGSTSLAVLSYMLTESATAYVDIYPPGTQFCASLNSVNAAGDVAGTGRAKNFLASLDGCATTTVVPVRAIAEIKPFRTPVITFWDGRDQEGDVVEDGDYVFVIYAALPSQRGNAFLGNAADRRVWSSVAKTGFLSVLRGMVGITQVTPTSTVVGSSPAVAGLNPFTFRYSLSRDATVSLKIFNATGNQLVKTLVDRENRPGSFANSETWFEGTNEAGQVVSSGTYLVQLTAQDPAQPQKISTTTAMFPVNLHRVTDVVTSPLLSSTSDNVTLSYQLSQSMFVAWNIYAPGSIIDPNQWPPCPAQSPPNACTSVTVLTPGGAPAVPLVTFRGMRPGRFRITEPWDGRDANGLFVPDGQYVFTLTAQSTATPKYFATDKIFGTFTIARGPIVFTQFSVLPDSPQLFNSSSTIELPPFTITYALNRQSSVTIQILNTNLPPVIVRTIIAGSVRPADLVQTDVWDGRDNNGNFPPTGFYLVRAVAEDVASVLSSGSTAQLTIAFDPLRIFDLAITPLRLDSGEAVISYQISETMKISIKIFKPGTIFDANGNPSPPESQSLVKRIVGVRPARTQIDDIWDGSDFTFSPVPDGNYRFKIVGSTAITAIDNITGDVINPGALSLDRPIDEIPIVRGGSAAPEEEFENFTFSYPNPATGPNVTFQVHLPFRGRVRLKLHSLAGDLIFDRDLGEAPPSFQGGPLTYVWNKANQSGQRIARGLYFAVIRVEETEGGANILQTVKKVLIP